MTRHIYSVGQQVSFGERVVTYLKRTGVFHHHEAFAATGRGIAISRQKCSEVHERVASEHELQVAELEKPIVAAG